MGNGDKNIFISSLCRAGKKAVWLKLEFPPRWNFKKPDLTACISVIPTLASATKWEARNKVDENSPQNVVL